MEVAASLFVVTVVVGVQPFVAAKMVGRAMVVLAQQFVPAEVVLVGVARVVAVLSQQFLPMEVVPIGVGWQWQRWWSAAP